MEFAKKKFGQNFISDKNLINKIINILDSEEEHLIIEIGPGKGALTQQLVNKYSKVIAIEIDADLEILLRPKIKNPNFELIIDDVLKINLEELILKNSARKISLISNTPYYITSEIIFETLKISKYLDKAIFMVQKEVASRICAKENENNYNNLSIAVQLYAHAKYEFTVNKKMFKPIPKVDSAIISLHFNDVNLNRVSQPEKFIAFVRKAFNNKRKTILNNLSNITLNKVRAGKILNDLKIDLNLRPENISLDKFILIFEEVQKND